MTCARINVLDLEAKLALKGNDAFLNGRDSHHPNSTKQCRSTRHATGSLRARRLSSDSRRMVCSTRSSHTPTWCRTATARARDRAVPDRPVVRRRQDAGESRRSPLCVGDTVSCRRIGKRLTSSGWRISSRGRVAPALVGSSDSGWVPRLNGEASDGVSTEQEAVDSKEVGVVAGEIRSHKLPMRLGQSTRLTCNR